MSDGSDFIATQGTTTAASVYCCIAHQTSITNFVGEVRTKRQWTSHVGRIYGFD